MRKFFFFIVITAIVVFAQDSLPWQGTIVFGDWVRVDDAPGLSGHPANHPRMIMDKNFNMYTVWQDDRNNLGCYNIYFSTSLDTGRTWTANINLSQGLPGNFDNRFPWITADDSGKLYVVWQRLSPGNNWKVYFCRSDDGGNSFTSPDTIKGVIIKNSTTSQMNSGPQPKIVADVVSDTTYLYLAWVDDGLAMLRINFARSVVLGDSFSNQIVLDHNPRVNREPDLSVTDSGVIHIVWRWGTGGTNNDPKPYIGYNKSTDRGISFMPNDIIVNDTTVPQSYRGNPIVTINNSNGNILVAFEDSRRVNDPHPDIFWARSIDQGQTFSENKRVNYFEDTLTAFENRKPSISIDPNGIAVVAWHDDNFPGGHFGIHLAAYNDSIGVFTKADSLFGTYTENNAGAFGVNLYPPSLYVTMIDSVTNFFIVWQDFSEDATGGNIYSVRGWVVKALADLDVDNDSLDVINDTINLRTQPAGPAYSPYAKREFILVNTSANYNPDSSDGPSLEDIDSIFYSAAVYGPNSQSLDSIFILNLSSSLTMGQAVICTLAVVIPENCPSGIYTGNVTIQGRGVVSKTFVQESFVLKVEGPEPRGSLDSLRVAPIPFKPHRNPQHDKIHFQGLTRNATVRVYDLSGTLVWSDTEDGDGHCAWDAKVASGIYIYLVTTPDGEVKKGKLSVIR